MLQRKKKIMLWTFTEKIGPEKQTEFPILCDFPPFFNLCLLFVCNFVLY